MSLNEFDVQEWEAREVMGRKHREEGEEATLGEEEGGGGGGGR